nr:MAG TPA: hypothetical protein [Caudoviricetes sp.]
MIHHRPRLTYSKLMMYLVMIMINFLNSFYNGS